MNNSRDERTIRLPSGATIFTVGLIIAVVAAGGFLFISMQVDSKERAAKRAGDLKMLKNLLIQNTGIISKDTPYPKTFTPNFKDYSGTKVTGWLNECENPKNWIPNLSKVLEQIPRDPTNSCRPKITGEPYPQYRYISDGFNFKIAVFRLGDEICSDAEFADLVDPARPCGTSEASWAVYTEGASQW